MAGLVCGLVLGTAVIVGHAADPSDEQQIAHAAELAGVDAQDLQGAVNSTGLDPFVYLHRVGELDNPPPLSPVLAQPPPILGALSRANCIIGKESGGLDKPNNQRSGADGPGQYFPTTWARHVNLYRAATGYAGSLSLHSLSDVQRVMAFMLATYPGSRSEWVVAGC